jgi:hypothetical protein
VGPTPLQLLTLQSKDQEGSDYVVMSAKLSVLRAAFTEPFNSPAPAGRVVQNLAFKKLCGF